MDERGVIVTFLKPEAEISETLERIGIRNYTEKKLWPTCYAYSMKDGSQHIAHFKELLRNPSMDSLDEKRRNSISRSSWHLKGFHLLAHRKFLEKEYM